MFDTHIHHHYAPTAEHTETLKSIFSLLNKIQMDQEQLKADLTALKDQAEKSKAEIIAKFATLEQAIADAGNVSVGVQNALADLKTSVQGVDDLVPDAPVEAPVDAPADPGTEVQA